MERVQLTTYYDVLVSSVSTTFKHSSANSMNSGSSIANFIAFQAFGAESTSLMKSRKCLFFNKSLRLSLFAEWKKIQNISDLLPSIARCWEFLTKLSQFIWMYCIFGCKLQDLLSRLLRAWIFSVALFVYIEWRWTFDGFVLLKTFERTAVNRNWNSLICKIMTRFACALPVLTATGALIFSGLNGTFQTLHFWFLQAIFKRFTVPAWKSQNNVPFKCQMILITYVNVKLRQTTTKLSTSIHRSEWKMFRLVADLYVCCYLIATIKLKIKLISLRRFPHLKIPIKIQRERFQD